MAAIFQLNSFQNDSVQLDDIIGAFACSEDGVDSLAAPGVLEGNNFLAVVEAGLDVSSMTGAAAINLAIAIPENIALDTLALQGAASISGSATLSETGADLAVLTNIGTTTVSGTIFMPGSNVLPSSAKKFYEYLPAPQGTVKLVTKAAARSRLTNETHYRSKDAGSAANLIELTLVEDTSLVVPEGLFVVHNKAIVPTEMLSATLMSVPTMKLFSFNVQWDQEVRIQKENGNLVAKLYGIRWQIAGGPSETLIETLGQITKDRVFTASHVSFKLSAGPADFPTGAVLYIKPRTRRYTLVATSDTDPVTAMTTTGWSIGDLRAAVAADSTGWITLPKRNTNSGDGETRLALASNAEDQQDEGQDASYLLPFGPTAMRGGDGLPAEPVGFNTGPDRTLIHLNYSELPNGSMGVLNQVFEWVGESSSVGAWQRYA